MNKHYVQVPLRNSYTLCFKRFKIPSSPTRPPGIMSIYRPRYSSHHSCSRHSDYPKGENASSRQSTNRFLGSMAYLAKKHGYNADDIIAIASVHHFSSADFCLDGHSNAAYRGADGDPAHYIPEAIVSDLRAHYCLKKNAPFAKMPSAQQRGAPRNQWNVYIPNKLTQQLVADDIILEPFDRSQRLYQYLNWTIRISAMAQTIGLLQGQNRCIVMLCHIELHDRRGRDLYALCIQNDVVSPKAQEWYDNVPLSELVCG